MPRLIRHPREQRVELHKAHIEAEPGPETATETHIVLLPIELVLDAEGVLLHEANEDLLQRLRAAQHNIIYT